MSVIELKKQGNDFLRQGKLLEARDAYTKGIEIDPENHLLYSNRSVTLLNAGYPDEAEADAKKVIQLKPDWFKGYVRHSQVLFFRGNFSECGVRTLKAGLDLCGDHPLLRSKMAEALGELNKKDPSLVHCDASPTSTTSTTSASTATPPQTSPPLQSVPRQPSPAIVKIDAQIAKLSDSIEDEAFLLVLLEESCSRPDANLDRISRLRKSARYRSGELRVERKSFLEKKARIEENEIRQRAQREVKRETMASIEPGDFVKIQWNVGQVVSVDRMTSPQSPKAHVREFTGISAGHINPSFPVSLLCVISKEACRQFVIKKCGIGSLPC